MEERVAELAVQLYCARAMSPQPMPMLPGVNYNDLARAALDEALWFVLSARKVVGK